MSDTKSQIARFTAIFAGGTLLSRVLGMVRDVLLAALMPPLSLNAFWMAFKLPNMFRDMLGEGAANAAFVPIFAESDEKETRAQYRELVSAVLSAMLILFGLLSVLGVLLMPWFPAAIEALRPLTGAAPKAQDHLDATVTLMQWTFPYLFFIGLTIFAMAPLFVARHYSTPSWSPVLLNLALIASCLGLRGRFEEPAWALVAGVWIGGILQLAVMYWAMRRHTGVLLPNFHLRHPGIRKAFWLLLPVIVGQSAGEINKLVDAFFAYALPGTAVSTLFFANRLVQLPLAVFGIAVSVAILPGAARAGARKDLAAVRDTLMLGLRQTFFLIAPAMIGLLVLRTPVVRLLFERGHFTPSATTDVSAAVFYYGLGLLSFSWVKVSVQGFYAVQDTKTPVMIAAASMLLNILLNCVLVGPLGFRGLALSTAIAYTVNFILLYAILCNRFGVLWSTGFLKALGQMVVAALMLGVVALGLDYRLRQMIGHDALWAQLLAVLIPVICAGLVYIAMCRVFHLPELDRFLAILRRRR
jgi:putative peptidoglycan lipid II flippase